MRTFTRLVLALCLLFTCAAVASAQSPNAQSAQDFMNRAMPAFVDTGVTEDIRPLTTICVDQTEFVVTKLRDRGTHQAYGVVTNAQDFMHVLRFYVERWQQSLATAATPAPRAS